MKEIARYQCEFCKKDFKTPDRHFCKKNPALKNCFTCKNLKGWLEDEDGADVGTGVLQDPNYPDCAAGVDGWNIEDIKNANYNMQCDKWSKVNTTGQKSSVKIREWRDCGNESNNTMAAMGKPYSSWKQNDRNKKLEHKYQR